MFTQNDLICAYTRKQAVEDDVQVLLTDKDAATVKEAGYRYPVYLTSGVFNLIKMAVDNKKHLNDWDGVLWDVLWMSRHGQALDRQTTAFTVIITGTGRKRNHQMLIQCGPTDIDNPAPALTIMMPDEQ